MKKLLFAVLLTLSFNTFAENYTGIWQAGGLGYVSWHEKGDMVFFIWLNPYDQEWDVYSAIREGNKATAKTYMSSVDAEIEITFLSDTSFSAVQTFCHGDGCLLPDGMKFGGNKIW